MENDEETIYDLRLHETLTEKHVSIMRVAGGWIYSFHKNSLFVPFDDEFQVKKTSGLTVDLDFNCRLEDETGRCVYQCPACKKIQNGKN